MKIKIFFKKLAASNLVRGKTWLLAMPIMTPLLLILKQVLFTTLHALENCMLVDEGLQQKEEPLPNWQRVKKFYITWKPPLTKCDLLQEGCVRQGVFISHLPDFPLPGPLV